MRHILFSVFIISCLIAGVMPQKAIAVTIETPAKQVILKDVETGQILFSKNQDQKMPTSSMSKIMTIYMLFDALKNGVVTMDTEFSVSKKAWEKGGSKMFVEVGKKVKVKDLIPGVIVQSGNDAAIVIAEGLAGGSEDKFARQMNKKAKELGMKNSHFANASGWPDPNHYSTAADLAILSEAVMKDFPEYYHFFSKKDFEYNDIKQPNRNPLLYRDIGADGLKTGHTEIGGYGLMGSAANNNRRVIMVANGLESKKQRADIGSQIIEWGLNGFENKTIYNAKSEVAGAKVFLGKSNIVPMIVKDDLRLTIPKTGKNHIKTSVHYNSPLKAPIKKGDTIGVLKISIPDMESFEYPLYAGQNIEELGFVKRAFANAKQLIKNTF